MNKKKYFLCCINYGKVRNFFKKNSEFDLQCTKFEVYNIVID